MKRLCGGTYSSQPDVIPFVYKSGNVQYLAYKTRAVLAAQIYAITKFNIIHF